MCVSTIILLLPIFKRYFTGISDIIPAIETYCCYVLTIRVMHCNAYIRSFMIFFFAGENRGRERWEWE